MLLHNVRICLRLATRCNSPIVAVLDKAWCHCNLTIYPLGMLALYQSARSGASFARSNMIHSQIQNPSPTLPLWKQNSAHSSNDPSIPVCQPVLPDQVLPQKIHFVMRGCRQQHLKAKAFRLLSLFWVARFQWGQKRENQSSFRF